MCFLVWGMGRGPPQPSACRVLRGALLGTRPRPRPRPSRLRLQQCIDVAPFPQPPLPQSLEAVAHAVHGSSSGSASGGEEASGSTAKAAAVGGAATAQH